MPELQERELYVIKGMAAYRAPSLSQPHRARKALAAAYAGRSPPPMGMFCAIGSPQITEIVAQMRFDFVWVEWEHASMSVERMTQVRVSRVIS
jgi:4-hydroxy-2-oxoheptanedioate aldolase